MKKRIIKIASVAIAALLVIAGCTWFAGPDGPDAEAGRLRVNVSSTGAARTILPPIAMEVAEFVITIERGEVSLSETVDVESGTATFSGLEPGEWNVTVEGRTGLPDQTIIARGEEIATIVQGQTTTVSMTIGPLDGEGTLRLELDWPAGPAEAPFLEDPGVTATLEPVGGGTPVDLSEDFSLNTEGDPHTATYTGAFEAGYYRLLIALTDGAVTVWADAYSVRIAEDLTTLGTFTLAESDLNLTGLIVTVDADLQNPYEIAFGEVESEVFTELDPFPEEIATDAGLTVVAQVTPDDEPDSWEWYLNGVLQVDVTGDSITIGGDTGVAIEEGTSYRLSLLVTHGSILSSKGVSFTAVGPED